jgi:hypothetical protein
MTCSLHDALRFEQTCSFRSQALADWLVQGLSKPPPQYNPDNWLFRSPKSP